jgi:hypothetical protein
MKNKVVTYDMMHNALHDVLSGLQDKSMKVSEAKEISNACGKVIQMGIGRLQYAVKNGASLEIPELGIGDFEMSQALPPKKKLLKSEQDYLDKCR